MADERSVLDALFDIRSKLMILHDRVAILERKLEAHVTADEEIADIDAEVLDEKGTPNE